MTNLLRVLVGVLSICTDLPRILINVLGIFTHPLCGLVYASGIFTDPLGVFVDVLGILVDLIRVLVNVLLYGRLSKTLDNSRGSVGCTHLVIRHGSIQVSDKTGQGLGMICVF